MEPNSEEFYNLIHKVNTLFYEKVFEDEWLRLIFHDVDQEHISNQQTDFIVGAFGGPKRYCGRSPKDAHPHLFIQEDMWELRESYLVEAFKETDLPKELQEKWLAIDNAFKKAILKHSVSECFGRYKTEEIINIPNPKKKAA